MGRIRIVGALAAAIVLVATVGVAEAKISNGNFEKGSFKAWKTKTSDASNSWEIYTNKTRVPSPPMMLRGPIAPPIKLPKTLGKYSPAIEMSGPGHNVLYRTIKVPKKAKKLRLKAFWHNDASAWVFSGAFQPLTDGDQYFSIDLLEPGSKPESTKPADVLDNVFAPDPELLRTAPNGAYGAKQRGAMASSTPYVSGWKGFGANLKPYRGEKVLLRLAEVDTRSFNYVGIDNVKIKK